MKAGKSIIFCASQRTGSTMVFDDLRNVLGCWPGNSEILYDHIILNKTALPWTEVWDEVSQVNRVAGYFIEKVMFHYTPRISQFIERGNTLGVRRCLKFRPELFDGFYNFFADAIWVYIDRRDVFSQAVSMYLAEATQVWEKRLGVHENGDAPAPVVAYDGERLKQYLQSFVAEREQWQVFFRHYNIAPLRISYEDAAGGYPHYLKELLDAAGLQAIEEPPARRLLKLSSPLNEEFAGFLRNEIIAELYTRHAGH